MLEAKVIKVEDIVEETIVDVVEVNREDVEAIHQLPVHGGMPTIHRIKKTGLFLNL